MIQLDNVTKRYPGGQEALSGLSLSVDKGEMLFVTGHSGAGKSTLLRLIALIERPTNGQVIVDGENTQRVRRRKIPAYRRQIGMVFQDHKLLYDRPVSDNVVTPDYRRCRTPGGEPQGSCGARPGRAATQGKTKTRDIVGR